MFTASPAVSEMLPELDWVVPALIVRSSPGVMASTDVGLVIATAWSSKEQELELQGLAAVRDLSAQLAGQAERSAARPKSFHPAVVRLTADTEPVRLTFCVTGVKQLYFATLGREPEHGAADFLDLKQSVEKACRLIREAGEKGADLAVFPEAMRKATEQMIAEAQKMKEKEDSRIIVPGRE